MSECRHEHGFYLDGYVNKCVNCGETIYGIAKSNAKLRSQLELAQDWINRSVVVLEKAEQARNDFQEEYIAQSKRAGQLQQDNDNLQAQAGVLRGALERIKEARSGTAVLSKIAYDALAKYRGGQQ